MNVICTKNAPAAVGPYSQAIDCGVGNDNATRAVTLNPAESYTTD